MRAGPLPLPDGPPLVPHFYARLPNARGVSQTPSPFNRGWIPLSSLPFSSYHFPESTSPLPPGEPSPIPRLTPLAPVGFFSLRQTHDCFQHDNPFFPPFFLRGWFRSGFRENFFRQARLPRYLPIVPPGRVMVLRPRLTPLAPSFIDDFFFSSVPVFF